MVVKIKTSSFYLYKLNFLAGFFYLWLVLTDHGLLFRSLGYKKWDTWLYFIFCNASKLVLLLSRLQACQWISQNNQYVKILQTANSMASYLFRIFSYN